MFRQFQITFFRPCRICSTKPDTRLPHNTWHCYVTHLSSDSLGPTAIWRGLVNARPSWYNSSMRYSHIRGKVGKGIKRVISKRIIPKDPTQMVEDLAAIRTKVVFCSMSIAFKCTMLLCYVCLILFSLFFFSLLSMLWTNLYKFWVSIVANSAQKNNINSSNKYYESIY